MVGLRPMSLEEIGCFMGYYGEGESIVFCLDPERFPQIDFDLDRVKVAGSFNNWGRSSNSADFYLKASSSENGSELYSVGVPRKCVVAVGKRITFKFVTESGHWLTPLRCAPNLRSDKNGNLNYTLSASRSGFHAFEFSVDGGRGIDQVAEVQWREERPCRILPGLGFYDLESKHPLGPCLEDGNTVIRLFAPRASRVAVELDQDTNFVEPQRFSMELCFDQVTWEVTLEGNFHGWFYRLFVAGPDDERTTLFDFSRPLLDPWARGTVGPEGPGIILDPNRAPKAKPTFKAPAMRDMSVLECHVRDLVQNAPIELSSEERRGFAGVSKYLRSENPYPKALGVNTLEFQPVQQFDSRASNEYHWGYMTNNYFAPSCWYGTKPEAASQNAEFFDMVSACHEQNLAVIIDVVYNHVGEPPNLLFIDKAYYFHLTPDGDLENWSGCGNVLRAESVMSLRLITESLLHFVEAYGVDGFRFDLAELIGIDVLKRVADTLRTVRPEIALIAEPWSFRGSIQWDCRMAGYAYWNDGFRECLKEYVHGYGDPGALAHYLGGCLDHMAAWPSQSVNYVESHDDRCWLDDITENENHNGEHPTHQDILRTHMMVAILNASIGVPMISCGQDFMRSKKGVSNTYRMGDINALDYGRIKTFQHTHEYFKWWIAFRQSEWGEIVRLEEKPGLGFIRTFSCDCDDSNAVAFLYNANRTLSNKQIILALNPHSENQNIHLCDVDGDGWLPVADIWNFNLEGINDHRLNSSDRRIYLGPMTLGLWIRH